MSHLAVEVLGKNGAYYRAFVSNVNEEGVTVTFENDWYPENTFPFHRVRLPPALPKDDKPIGRIDDEEVEVFARGDQQHAFGWWRAIIISIIGNFRLVQLLDLNKDFPIFVHSDRLRLKNTNQPFTKEMFYKVAIAVPEDVEECSEDESPLAECKKSLRAAICKYKMMDINETYTIEPLTFGSFDVDEFQKKTEEAALVGGEKRAGGVSTKVAPAMLTQKVSSSATHRLASAASARRTEKILVIELVKGTDGLGFTITFRDDHAEGNSAIYIKTIHPKGAAIEDGRLKPGDCLLEINGIPMTLKSLSKAVPMLRNVPFGNMVQLVVSRQVIEDYETTSEKESNTSISREEFSEEFTVKGDIIKLAKRAQKALDLNGVSSIDIKECSCAFKIFGETKEAIKRARAFLEIPDECVKVPQWLARNTHVPRNEETSSDLLPFVRRFCRLEGNEFFCEVDAEFIYDKDNHFGLHKKVKSFGYAFNIIVNKNEPGPQMDFLEPEIQIEAEALYGLIHARYILTEKGMAKMLAKQRQGDFGTCSRVYCENQPMLPIGLSEDRGESTMKLYCAKCANIYTPSSLQHRKIDGAYFGTVFIHKFFTLNPECKPKRPSKEFIPSLYGFKIHPVTYQRDET